MIAVLIEAAIRSLLLGLGVWGALRVARVRHPQVETTAWIVVLLASLAMPVLMRLSLLRLPSEVVTLPAVVLGTDHAPTMVRTLHEVASAHRLAAAAELPVVGLLPLIYGVITALLLFRLATGLARTWRIVRAARPIRAQWTLGADVRVTASVMAPVTFGRVILVPISFISWSPAKRRAVMGHELSHVAHHDFTIQVLSQLNSAIFWFSPFAWWLQQRLAALAETTSDEVAILGVGDRVSYAEILLDMARGARRLPAGIAMARPALMKARIEHILAKAAPIVTLPRRVRLLLAASLLPAVLLIGGTSWRAQASGGLVSIAALPAIPPIPAIPAIPPIPPIPASDGGFHGDVRPFAILTGGHSMISAGGDTLKRLLDARDKVGSEAILFIGPDGEVYAITDAALVEQGADMFRPETDLADQEKELSDQQAELGREQAELGRQQGELGRKMSELSRQYGERLARRATMIKTSLDADAAASEREDAKAKYKEAMAELTQEQSELGREQGRLGGEQSRLGAQQNRLGREQSRVAHDGDVRLTKLLDAAIVKGTAKPIE